MIMTNSDSNPLIEALVSGSSTDDLLHWMCEDLSECVQLLGTLDLKSQRSVARSCLGAIKRELVDRGIKFSSDRKADDLRPTASARRRQIRVPPTNARNQITRMMYVECKANGHDRGRARICRVRFSKSGRTIYLGGLILASQRGAGIMGNYIDANTGIEYWVSGPKKNGQDRHWAGSGDVRIEADVVDEYWRDVRACNSPDNPYLT
jgi:hypothetical protein